MDSDSIITVIIMIILVLFSSYFSATETAFSSLNHIRLKNLAQEGSRKAKTALYLFENFDKLLTTILVGNNIVNIALASIGTVFFVKHFGDIGATLSTAVITIVVLIFGEISPKSLAKESPLKFALFSTPFIYVLSVILTPITFVFSKWKALLSRLFKVRSNDVVTEDELLTIVDEAQHHGGIDKQESELIRCAIEFNDLCAEDIITPRVDVEAVEINDKNGEIAKLFTETGFSRLPVYDGSIDNIVGILNLKDFYGYVYHHDKTVEQVMSEPLFITGSMPVGDLLSELQSKKSHIAVVADEYGGTEGIVTMEDILEELVGEIWDEHDSITHDIVKSGDDCYKVDCSTDFDEFAEFFKLDMQTESATVGGWVMEQLGKIAEVGDMFKFERLNVLVTKTEEHRVLEIIVKVPQSEQNGGENTQE